ncbi:hypothetical protein G9A89_013461 [Geosiphon pyriformis]|nr:hypothetical protein G9A89_013461 [Geosiphon pyriformis]
MDKTKRLFNNTILQQLEYFVGKNNLFTQVRAIYRIYTVFQDWLKILLNKAIDTVTVNQLGKITNVQFEELQTQITQIILEKEIQEIIQTEEFEKLGDRNWENSWKHISTIDTIEFLLPTFTFIIAFEHQITDLLLNLTAEIITCNNGNFIKLILDSGSAGSIITKQLMNQLALVNNDWLSKAHVILDWDTQELQLSQNVQRRKRETHLESLPSVLGQRRPQQATTNTFLEQQKKKKTKGKTYLEY